MEWGSFHRKEGDSKGPFPSPGDLPDPETEPRSPALQVDCLLSEPPGKPVLAISDAFHMQREETRGQLD